MAMRRGLLSTVLLISMAPLIGNLSGQEEAAPKVLTKWSDLKGVPGFEDLEGIDDPTMLNDIEDLEDLEQFKGLPGFEDLENDALMAELDLQLPTWDFETSLAGSLGYKDNILLRPVDGESSGFWRTDLESMLWRYPDGKTEFVAMLGFTDVRYFSAEETDGEQTVFLHAAWDWNTTGWSTFSLPAQVLYQDQVLDFSATEAETVIGQVQVFSFSTNPEWNVAAGENLEVGISGLYRVDHFREGPDDFQDAGGRLRANYKFGLWADLDLRYTIFRRDFATRVQYTAGGRPIVGTELQADQRRAEGRFNLKFDPDSDWAVKAKVGHLEYRDNGSGYFDYDRSRLGLELTWTPGPWRFFLSGSRGHYDYLLQTIFNEESGQIEQREKDDFYGQFRIERTLNESFGWHFDGEAERSETNDFYGTYNAVAVFSGITWTF
jgi:hypothetical protein